MKEIIAARISSVVVYGFSMFIFILKGIEYIKQGNEWQPAVLFTFALITFGYFIIVLNEIEKKAKSKVEKPQE